MSPTLDYSPPAVSSTSATFEDRLERVLANAVDNYSHLVSCERLSGGANQETYRIVVCDGAGERRLALRRAAGGSAASQSAYNIGLTTEALLFQVARDAGVPTPEIIRVLEPADDLGDGFIMAWLDGETLGSRIVRAPELNTIRPQLAAQCGRILARIHAIDLRGSGLDKILEATTPAEFIESTWARYQALNTPQPMIDFTARWLLDNLPPPARTSLVHNDFRNGNLMIDQSGITGVLDWEIAHIGDPIRDLGWLCTNSWRFGHSELPVGGFGHYASLIAAYEAESGEKVDRDHLRFWEVFGSFWWAVGCLQMVAQYRSGPDRSVERPAIGRRSSECQADCVNLLIAGPVDLVEPSATPVNDDLPHSCELLGSVREFLHDEIMPATDGRRKFLARVAANSLDIVARELALGPAQLAAEQHRLLTLLGHEDSLAGLRWRLVNGLRDRSIDPNRDGLAAHLRNTVVNRLAIDQPSYSGFKTATQQQQ